VTLRYLDSLHQTQGSKDLRSLPRRSGLSPVITGVDLTDSAGREISAIHPMTTLQIHIRYESPMVLEDPRFDIAVEDGNGRRMFSLQTAAQLGKLPTLASSGSVICHVPRFPLMPGRYYMTFGYVSRRIQVDLLDRAKQIDVVEGDAFGSGRLPPRSHGPFLVDAVWDVAKPNESTGDRPSAGDFVAGRLASQSGS
jgi:lipopolysaccharide transport system ATP-binding protein